MKTCEATKRPGYAGKQAADAVAKSFPAGWRPVSERCSHCGKWHVFLQKEIEAKPLDDQGRPVRLNRHD